MKMQLRIRGLQDVFTFGRWKGQTLQTVLDEDPDYILWVDEKIKDFPIDQSVVDQAIDSVFDEKMDEQVQKLRDIWWRDDDD